MMGGLRIEKDNAREPKEKEEKANGHRLLARIDQAVHVPF
jgi:hypothetical protein